MPLTIPKPDHIISGQPYWIVASPRPYTCQDGRAAILETWQSFCATCGEPFTFEAPRKEDEPLRYLDRRCPLHKRPGLRVGSRTERRRIAEDHAEAASLLE